MSDDGGAAAVGLARLEVADDVRTRIKNEVVLEAAIAEVSATLFVFVDTDDAHAAVKYTSELYNVTWDLASAAGKPQLEIKIAAPPTSALSWDELFCLPQLNVVFGDVPAAAEEIKWLQRGGDLLPVQYRSPAETLRLLFMRGVTFFDDIVQSQATWPVVVVNGTFDHLHNGHRKLLSLAASVCRERLIIGVTASQELLDAKPLAHLIEPLETRKRKVREFVASINSALQIELVDVFDALGPSANSDDNRTLVVASTGDLEAIKKLRAWRSVTNQADHLMRLLRRTDRSTLSSRRVRERIAAKSSP